MLFIRTKHNLLFSPPELVGTLLASFFVVVGLTYSKILHLKWLLNTTEQRTVLKDYSALAEVACHFLFTMALSSSSFFLLFSSFCCWCCWGLSKTVGLHSRTVFVWIFDDTEEREDLMAQWGHCWQALEYFNILHFKLCCPPPPPPPQRYKNHETNKNTMQAD